MSETKTPLTATAILATGEFYYVDLENVFRHRALPEIEIEFVPVYTTPERYVTTVTIRGALVFNGWIWYIEEFEEILRLFKRQIRH